MSKLPFSSSARTNPTVLIAIVILSLIALACDSGGGSGASTVPAGTGTASVFLTDAPSDDFDEILVTITAVELLGADGPIVIFRGRETVDLKELEDFSDLFVYAEGVPVGRYSKIRMRVERVVLVDGDDETEVDPPADGHIDLLPRGPFEIREGVHLVIEIDMDAKKSIHISGNDTAYNFRPVVFMQIRETLSPAKLARVHGEVTELLDGDAFELCSTVFMAARDEETWQDPASLGERHRCMTVETNDETGIFDPNGDPVEVDEINEGDEVTVVGRFHWIDRHHEDMMSEQGVAGPATPASETRHADHHEALEDWLSTRETRDEEDDESNETPTRPERPEVGLVFVAYVVEIGPPGTFLSLRGLVESEVDAADEFDFAVEPGQGFGDDSVLTALLQDGTRIFSRRGRELDEDDISPDTRAKIDGVLDANSRGAFYKSSLVVLDIDDVESSVLRGEILATDDERRRLLLEVDDEGARTEECVEVLERARILLIRGDENEEAEFEDLVPGMRASAYGPFEEIDGCLLAHAVLAFPFDCRDDRDCEPDQFCGTAVGECGGAGICQSTPELCSRIFDPVCGCDEETYSNACTAAAAGVNVASEGECGIGSVSCRDNGDCGSREFCRKREGRCDAEGVCEPRPQLCPLVIDPVCGCDGETYDNACAAAGSGVSVEDGEACRSNNGVAVCHIPPGNPSARHTIFVGEPAVSAHLRHGDYRGRCRD